MATTVPVTLDTPITIKVQIEGSNRKFRLPLRDLTLQVLPTKLRHMLGIPAEQDVVFERFSDSAGAFVTLDSNNPQVYKTLFRAAKAKLKLRIRATIPSENNDHSARVAPPPLPPPPPAPIIPNPQYAELATTSVAGPATLVHLQATPSTIPPPVPSTVQHTENIIAPRVNEMRTATILQKSPEPKMEQESEAAVPRPVAVRDNLFAELNNISREHELAFRTKDGSVSLSSGCSWSVYCNACDKAMADEHYHCSICDDGDYDLCASCVDAGVHCPGEGHWLIKRFVKNGSVINSTTERIAPKMKKAENEMPGAFTDEKRPEPEPEHQGIPTRTCNSCVKVFCEKDFVTCASCDDFDLCMPCHIGAKHGHHPGHAFLPATADTQIGPLAEFLCAPGRNVRHAAVCDGCDKFIYGVRHKCLNCPDFDYCSECVKNSRYIHPAHRFVPIYEPLPEPRNSSVRHYGIYCDGPLCKARENQSYIEGIRYKCAVCHDTDFCANCEAIPHNRHNRTHPLIMFKTPVRNVSVTTMGEDKNGSPMAPMGDHPPRRSSAAETRTAPTSANAATQVQTIVDLKPTEDATPKPVKEKIEIKDLLAEPIHQKIKVMDLLTSPVVETVEAEVENPKAKPGKETPSRAFAPPELNAHFIRDAIPDGSKLPASMVFTQVWTLKNPGPQDWPAGCSVRYVGGDNMLNVDDSHPSSAHEIAGATESNPTFGPVRAGEEVDFRVRMKAPKREGTAISYWRLKAADGTPFGHRLWCHINVVSQMPDAADMPDGLRAQLAAWKAQVQTQEYRERLMRLIPEQRQDTELSSKMQEMKLESGTTEEKEQEKKMKMEKSQTATGESSSMIFPQLDKESPVSSTLDVTQAEAEPTKATSAPSVTTHDEDLSSFGDDEIVDILDGSSDGFLTDEEYDILDASDEDRA